MLPSAEQGDQPFPEQRPMSRRRLLATGGAAAGALVTAGWRGPLGNDEQTAKPSAQGKDAALGAALYRAVKEYADLGDHRTGTSVDEQTTKWLAAQLTDRGAKVELQEYNFDRYDARVRVTVDGKETAAWPLYYEAAGRVKTDKPYVGQVDLIPGSATRMTALLQPAREARAAAVVLATTGAEGRLIAINRRPTLGQGPPTIFVPGALADKLAKAKVEVDFEAELKPARSANLIARFGANADQSPVLIATPLTGWFRCAGERGTSIAIALELASEIAKLTPVVVLGASGQELYGLGVRHYLQKVREQAAPRPRAIVHLGASIAAGRSDKGQRAMRLSDQRYVATSLSKARHDQLMQALRPLNLQATHNADKDARNPERWRGEARLLCLFGVPLLSFAGVFPLFHTPDDLPELTTSPALLSEVCRTATEAARLMLTER